MLFVRFLVGPLRVKTRQACRGGDDDDEPPAPPFSLWERAKATARGVVEKAKDTIRDVGERLKGLFDDPIARTTRLLALAEAFKVTDMQRKAIVTSATTATSSSSATGSVWEATKPLPTA